jgi:MinD-like ATPase involved in chromosome partitioning or flagellar assembly
MNPDRLTAPVPWPASSPTLGHADSLPPSSAHSARWISVAGVCRGAGTTTLAALLTSAYAAYRRYRIIVVDADPTGGALGVRLSTAGTATIADVGAAAAELTSFSRVARFLDQTPDGAWAVTGRAGTTGEPTQSREAIAALSAFFAVGVLDCGLMGHPQSVGLLAAAHARLLAAPTTVDGVLAVAASLDWIGMQDDADARARCAVALVSTTQRPGVDISWAARLLTARGARVIPVPYDPSLSVRGTVRPNAVSDGTRAVVHRLAAEMLSRSTRSGS